MHAVGFRRAGTSHGFCEACDHKFPRTAVPGPAIYWWGFWCRRPRHRHRRRRLCWRVAPAAETSADATEADEEDHHHEAGEMSGAP